MDLMSRRNRRNRRNAAPSEIIPIIASNDSFCYFRYFCGTKESQRTFSAISAISAGQKILYEELSVFSAISAGQPTKTNVS